MSVNLEGLFAYEFLKAMDKNHPFEEFDREDEFDYEGHMDTAAAKHLPLQQKLYKLSGVDLTPNLHASNDAGRTYTPCRKPLPFKETNACQGERPIYLKYRPVRAFVEGIGMRAMLKNVASYLQTIGHWALVVGPYTYDVYSNKGSIRVAIGEWEEMPPGEKSRIKTVKVGKTVCTDEMIWKTALMVYRFVRTMARRIVVHEHQSMISVWITMLRVYRMFPASFFSTAFEYSKCSGEVCAKTLWDLIHFETSRTLREKTAELFQAAFFFLTAGPLFGFLNMVKELKGWDAVEDHARYIHLLEKLGFAKSDLLEFFLRGAFGGPSGMRDFFLHVSSW